MPTCGENISQIQIGGLQPCDDLTWNDPGIMRDYEILGPWFAPPFVINFTNVPLRYFHDI